MRQGEGVLIGIIPLLRKEGGPNRNKPAFEKGKGVNINHRTLVKDVRWVLVSIMILMIKGV